MFDIGWSELLLVVVVAILVVGPKDLPRLMRTFGHYVGKLKRAAAEFQNQLNEAVAEDEIKEVRRSIESIRSAAKTDNLEAPVYKPWTRSKGPDSASASGEHPGSETADTRRLAKTDSESQTELIGQPPMRPEPAQKGRPSKGEDEDPRQLKAARSEVRVNNGSKRHDSSSREAAGVKSIEEQKVSERPTARTRKHRRPRKAH